MCDRIKGLFGGLVNGFAGPTLPPHQISVSGMVLPIVGTYRTLRVHHRFQQQDRLQKASSFKPKAAHALPQSYTRIAKAQASGVNDGIYIASFPSADPDIKTAQYLNEQEPANKGKSTAFSADNNLYSIVRGRADRSELPVRKYSRNRAKSIGK